MVAEVQTFHWADFLVFGICLIACAFAGVIMSCFSKKKSAKEMMMGQQDIHYVPVAMSVVASFMTAPFILGTPAEVYFFGCMFLLSMIGYFIGVPVVAHVFLMVFHRLNVPSPYKYLSVRFTNAVRLVAVIVFILVMMFFAGMVIYAPALAFSVVTGMKLERVIIAVGLICTIYTAVGGLAAVILLDMAFMTVITAFLLTLVIKGSIDAGGIGHVWQMASDTDRLNVVVFTPDPLERHSFWTQTVGVSFMIQVFLIANGAAAQKLLSLGSLRDGQAAAYISGIGFLIFLVLLGLVGLIMHAYYYGCDPLLSGRITSNDQLLPLFMMDLLGEYHGLPGFFTAAVFGASLSPVAAGLNAMGGLILIDFVMPIYVKMRGKPLPFNKMKWVAKSISVILGLLAIAIAFTGQLFGTTLLQIVLSVFSCAGSPILGIMFLGLFFPFANEIGAIVALLVSLALGVFIMGGAVASDLMPQILPLSTNSCVYPVTNTTARPDFTSISLATNSPDLDQTSPEIDMGDTDTDNTLWIHQVSYMWYSLIGVFVALLVGVIVSLLTGCICPKTRQEKINPKAILGPCNCGCCYCFSDGRYHVDSDPQPEMDEVNPVTCDPSKFELRNRTSTYVEVVINGKPPMPNGTVDINHVDTVSSRSGSQHNVSDTDGDNVPDGKVDGVEGTTVGVENAAFEGSRM